MKKLDLVVLIAALLTGCGGEKKDDKSDPKLERADEAIVAMIKKIGVLNETLGQIEDKASAEKHKPEVETILSEIETLKEQIDVLGNGLTDEGKKKNKEKHGDEINGAWDDLTAHVSRLEKSPHGAEIAAMIIASLKK